MGTLYVTEYRDMAFSGRGANIMAPRAPAVKHQAVSIGAGHLESNTFQGETHFIRVHTDAICSIDIGEAPIATTGMARLVAGQTEYFGVSGAYKISVIGNT